MKKYRFVTLCTILFMSVLTFTSCSSDDDDYSEESSESNLSKPQFEKDLTKTLVGSCDFVCRFSNGGDTKKNMKCKVYYKEYSSKPQRTPKVSDLTGRVSMSIESSTSTTTDFIGIHSSSKGYTVYYIFECSNSKYTTQSSIKSLTVKK